MDEGVWVEKRRNAIENRIAFVIGNLAKALIYFVLSTYPGLKSGATLHVRFMSIIQMIKTILNISPSFDAPCVSPDKSEA
jgi:hypothetical protein